MDSEFPSPIVTRRKTKPTLGLNASDCNRAHYRCTAIESATRS